MDTPLVIPPHATIMASKEQVSCNLQGEALILHLPRGIYYGLDPIGAHIWQLIQQPRTVQEVCDTIVEEYDVTVERCAQDLQTLLQQFATEGLIEIQDARPT